MTIQQGMLVREITAKGASSVVMRIDSIDSHTRKAILKIPGEGWFGWRRANVSRIYEDDKPRRSGWRVVV